MSTKPEVKQEAIARLLNGEKDLQIRCALELGYDAGWDAAIEAASRVAATTSFVRVVAAICELKGEPS